MFARFRSMPQIERWPLVSSFGQRLLSAFSESGQLCIGIDPSAKQLQSWDLPNSAAGAEQFSNQILDAAAGSVEILKPQVAFFEQFGSLGFAALERVLERAKEQGFLVIADAKRGDIGTTMQGYAQAWLSSAGPFVADALTLSPYLGEESLEETIELAEGNNKGVFILAATSNAEAKILQSSVGVSNLTVAKSVTQFATAHNKSFLGSVGVVIGATTHFSALGIDKGELSNTPILSPGFGAQGSKLSDARDYFGNATKSVIFNVSRSVAGDFPEGLQDRVKAAKQELEIGLSK